MSTIQKAFILIVVVLAVLTAAVNLVLFAQRTDWQDKYTKENSAVKTAQAESDTIKKELAAANDAHAALVAKLEGEVGALKAQLEAATRDLESVRSDKSRQETLAAELKVNFENLSNNVEVLTLRTKELQEAKELAESKLEEARAAAMNAEEAFVISDRKSRDLATQVDSLNQQMEERDTRIKLLQQKVDVLLTYAPNVGPSVEPVTGKPVHGQVASFSKDGSTVFISVGSDDGVVESMLLLIYKKGGNFVAFAKVYDVSADKAAARIVQPVYGTIAEGDYVTNK